MNKLKKIVLLALLSASFSTMADKYTNGVTIGSIEVYGDSDFTFESSTPISGSGCQYGGKLFRVYGSNPTTPLNPEAKKAMLSVAMMAFAAGMKVNVYHSDDQHCLVSRLKVTK